jgi:O-antigen/teichoic acid export membrane protein
MSIKKNYLYNLILSISNVVFPLVTFPYASRILNPEGIGRVQFVISFAQYFSIVAALGIPIYGINQIAKAKKCQSDLNNIFSELFIIHLISTLIVLIIYLTLVFSIPTLNQDKLLFLIATGVILLGTLSLDWFFNGLEEFKLVAIRSFAVKSIGLILLFTFVHTQTDVIPYIFVLTFILVGNNIINIFLLRGRVDLKSKGLNFKQHTPHLIFIFSTIFAATVYTNLDTVILGFLSNKSQVGFYAAGTKLSKAAIPIITAFCAVLLPRVAQSISNKDSKLEEALLTKSFSFISFIAVPAFFGLWFLRENIIILFSGESFLPAAEGMIYMALLPLLIGFGYVFAYQVLVPHGLNKQMFTASIYGLITFILVNIILVPKFGFIGTAISIALTELVVTFSYIYFTPKRLLKILPWNSLLQSGVICILFLPIVMLIKSNGFNNISELVLAIISCAFVYFSLQYVLFKNTFIQEGLSFLIKKNHT